MARGRQPEQPCGTTAAAQRHYRRRERLCAACQLAVDLARNRLGTMRPDHREIRNGLPEFRPYRYRGLGYDQYEQTDGTVKIDG